MNLTRIARPLAAPLLFILGLLPCAVTWTDEVTEPLPQVVYEPDVYTRDVSRFLDFALTSTHLDLVAEEAGHLTDLEKDLICLVAHRNDLPVETLNDRWLQLGWSGPYFSASPVRAARAISKPNPSYSEAARKQRIQGEVVAYGVIDKNGRTRSITISEGEPLLALEAMKVMTAWTFHPALLKDQPVPVCHRFVTNFRLQ